MSTQSGQSGVAAVNGINLHYQRTGGGPAVVLVHGMTDHGGYWSRVVRALAADYEVITYDMRGHGASDAPSEGYTPEHYARDLLGLIAALELSQPAVVGHSLGATTSAAAAALDPWAVGRIVLEDPPWFAGVMPADQRVIYAEQWRAQVAGLQELDHEGRVAACRAEHPTWDAEDCAAWAESKRLVRPAIFSGFDSLMAYPWQHAASQIECPALLIAGDPELGGLITPAVAQEFVGLAGSGQAAHLPGAGHAIHREQFEAFVAAVRAFLG